jgi:hypothetical protein
MIDFGTWRRIVNRKIVNVCGLEMDDLPDQPYYEWFEEGMDAEEAALIALEEAGWDTEEEE